VTVANCSGDICLSAAARVKAVPNGSILLIG
jgi:hypothetical protein